MNFCVARDINRVLHGTAWHGTARHDMISGRREIWVGICREKKGEGDVREGKKRD